MSDLLAEDVVSNVGLGVNFEIVVVDAVLMILCGNFGCFRNLMTNMMNLDAKNEKIFENGKALKQGKHVYWLSDSKTGPNLLCSKITASAVVPNGFEVEC